MEGSLSIVPYEKCLPFMFPENRREGDQEVTNGRAFILVQLLDQIPSGGIEEVHLGHIQAELQALPHLYFGGRFQFPNEGMAIHFEIDDRF